MKMSILVTRNFNPIPGMMGYGGRRGKQDGNYILSDRYSKINYRIVIFVNYQWGRGSTHLLFP